MRVAEVHQLRETEVPPHTTEILPVDNSLLGRIRKQAYENAVTLVFLALCFAITWIMLLLMGMGLIP